MAIVSNAEGSCTIGVIFLVLPQDIFPRVISEQMVDLQHPFIFVGGQIVAGPVFIWEVPTSVKTWAVPAVSGRVSMCFKFTFGHSLVTFRVFRISSEGMFELNRGHLWGRSPPLDRFGSGPYLVP